MVVQIFKIINISLPFSKFSIVFFLLYFVFSDETIDLDDELDYELDVDMDEDGLLESEDDKHGGFRLFNLKNIELCGACDAYFCTSPVRIELFSN